MMKLVSRVVRALTSFALLGGAISSAHPQQGLAAMRVASGPARYTSAAYGYSLLAPTSWVRLPGVRWTPAGPVADLTLMTPDHQAALGVIVTPTGGRRYADAELRSVALRLLYQENGVVPTSPVQQTRVVVNGVPFETALSFTYSGFGIYTYGAETLVAVLVTQRYNRLYALPAVMYVHQGAQPPSGAATPTPTPEGGYGVAPGVWQGGQAAAAAPAPLPTAGPVATARRLVQGPAGPPQPLPTDHLRGNPYPDASDGALIIRDKNCAYNVEAQALTAMQNSFRFTAQATPDGRPAALVGADGFAVAADPALGVRLEYPAHWKAVSAPHTNAGLQSADRNVLVTLAVQRTDAETVGTSDLQSLADSQISQVVNGPPPTFRGQVSYQTMRVNGILYLRALAPNAQISSPSAGALQAAVSVTVASYHHRVYSLRAFALTYLGSLDANSAPPAVYPYFTPFTTLARLTQSTADLLLQQSNLAVQTTLSLFIDPHVPEA